MENDLFNLLNIDGPIPEALSKQAKANVERVRQGRKLALEEPSVGKQAWHEEVGASLGVSGRMVRHWISAARSVDSLPGQEPVPVDLLEGSIKDIPGAVERYRRGDRSPTRLEKLQRWKRRASTLLTTLDNAGTLAMRLEAAEVFLKEVERKVVDLRNAKAHSDAQPKLRHAHLRHLPFSMVPWRGPSTVDGAPIRVILSAVRNTSGSRKTGDMVQLVLTRDDLHPSEALEQGKDRSVCGDCIHRTGPDGLKTCYVVVPKRSVRVPWEKSCKKETDLEGAIEAIKLSDVPLRVGRYGNPSAMPFEVAERLILATRDHRGRLRYTSFEHSWRDCDQRWKKYSVASVDTPEEYHEAKGLGWRTFRVKLPEEPVFDSEIVCPAAEEAGRKAQCNKCLLCSGMEGRGKKDIVLDAHGGGGKIDRYRAWRERGSCDFF